MCRLNLLVFIIDDDKLIREVKNHPVYDTIDHFYNMKKEKALIEIFAVSGVDGEFMILLNILYFNFVHVCVECISLLFSIQSVMQLQCLLVVLGWA